jgi:putative ABC transport system permease protein
MKTADLKFNRENVLVVNIDAGFKDEKAARPQLKSVINELRSRADIVSLSLSQNVPGRYWGNYNRFNKEDGSDGLSLRKAYVDDQYLPVYDIKVIEGRNFSDQYTDSSNAVMLNSAAVKALGWTTAVGKTLKENGDDHLYTVVGVFDDFHYRSLDGTVEPLIHFYFNKVQHVNFISLRLAPEAATHVIPELEKQWASLDSWLGLNYFFVDEEFNNQYKGIERTLLLIAIFTCVAIVISCSGIFALSAISAQQRTKEIGIRKVLGATVSNIVGLLSMDYMKLVVVAIALAAPLAGLGMSKWLEEFAYKIDLEWWIFGLAGILALLIAFLTTGFQSIKAARNNPVESLHVD